MASLGHNGLGRRKPLKQAQLLWKVVHTASLGLHICCCKLWSPLCTERLWWNISSEHSDGTGSWNPSLQEIMTSLFHIVNTIAADVLGMHNSHSEYSGLSNTGSWNPSMQKIIKSLFYIISTIAADVLVMNRTHSEYSGIINIMVSMMCKWYQYQNAIRNIWNTVCNTILLTRKYTY